MPGDRCSLGTQPCFPSSLLPSLGMAPPAPPCTCHLDGAQPHLHGLPPTTCPSPFPPHLTETAPPPRTSPSFRPLPSRCALSRLCAPHLSLLRGAAPHLLPLELLYRQEYKSHRHCTYCTSGGTPPPPASLSIDTFISTLHTRRPRRTEKLRNVPKVTQLGNAKREIRAPGSLVSEFVLRSWELV